MAEQRFPKLAKGTKIKAKDPKEGKDLTGTVFDYIKYTQGIDIDGYVIKRDDGGSIVLRIDEVTSLS